MTGLERGDVAHERTVSARRAVSTAARRHLTRLAQLLASAGATTVSLQALQRVAATCPHLLTVSPDLLAGNVIETAERLHIPLTDYLAAVLGRPRLFTHLPDSAVARIEELAELTGLTQAQCTAAAVRSSSLLCCEPRTIARNIRGLARRADLPKKTE